MQVWGVTDRGAVRQQNQDAYAVQDTGTCGFTVCVVCDGMGGPGGGKLASELAVETFMSVCLDKLSPEMDLEGAKQVAESAVAAANAAVYERSCEGSMRGMGTTLVAALILPGAAYMVHVGDSRGYLLEGETIRQVTVDHSLVQLLVDRGEITPAQARIRPQKNLITRALGVDSRVEYDLNRLSPGPGSRLLLCSDGLSNLLEDDTLLRLSRQEEDPERFCRGLVEQALERGAPDNVTVVLAQL